MGMCQWFLDTTRSSFGDIADLKIAPERYQFTNFVVIIPEAAKEKGNITCRNPTWNTLAARV
jgi:hypothetical protein